MAESTSYTVEQDLEHNIAYLGENIFARDEQGNLKHRIVTAFPRSRMLVTEPSTLHGDQCVEYINYLSELRAADNALLFTEEQKQDIIDHAVALTIIDGGPGLMYVVIRPDPQNMSLAFQADEQLQALFPKYRIFFMHTNDKTVRQAIRERGESWRIQPLPKSKDGMRRTVKNNKLTLKVSQRKIYYYNMQTGARYLSYETFANLAELDDETLRAFLKEIQHYSPLKNREGYGEILFFKANTTFSSQNFQGYNFDSMTGDEIRHAHDELAQQFKKALFDPFYQKDDMNNREWLLSIFQVIANLDKFSTEEVQLGLCEEFALKINWLPGGRIDEHGGIIKDPVYTQINLMNKAERSRYDDIIPQRLLQTLVRENFLIEYSNIGYLPPIRSRNTAVGPNANVKPRRSVYIMQVKRKGEPERISIIRLQKWGVREMLDEGKNLVEALTRAENYTDYVLNRRLACHLLQMNLPQTLIVRRFTEIYHGKNKEYDNMPIHTVYYEREYVPGIASYLLTAQYFQNPENGREFAVRFAQLLGAAAASNLIVGRSYKEPLRPLFDDGDEVLLLDDNGMPKEIQVSEQPGTFVYYMGEMERQVQDYAIPLNRRAFFISNMTEVTDAYVESFRNHFTKIQNSAEVYRKTFDVLPDHRPGSMFDKWNNVLDRLRDSNVQRLTDMLYCAIEKN